ncbi:hypothetical protein [Thermaurantiacus sp.]
MSRKHGSHWYDDSYWVGSLDRYLAHRDGGARTLTIDISAVEGAIFRGEGPGYRLFEAMNSIRNDASEQSEGFRGVPRLCLAFLMHLHEISERGPEEAGEEQR